MEKNKADLIVAPAPPNHNVVIFGVLKNSGFGPETLPVNYGDRRPTLKFGARGAQGRFCDPKTNARVC